MDNTIDPPDRDYRRVEAAIRFLDRHSDDPPNLDRVAEEIGLSPFHFQRLFQRWAGVSPKRFLQAAAAARVRQTLATSGSVLDAALTAGLSGPGRLHDLCVAVEAATPGEIRSGGSGLTIWWGLHPSPFGSCFVAFTERGVCRLAFPDSDEGDEILAALRLDWPKAKIIQDANTTRSVPDGIMKSLSGDATAPLSVLVKGTNFQIQVWRALVAIPAGRVASYDRMATAVGCPRGARAVGGAVGANRVALLIPCHRVIRATGAVGQYRWGSERKRMLLAWEAVNTPQQPGHALQA